MKALYRQNVITISAIVLLLAFVIQLKANEIDPRLKTKMKALGGYLMAKAPSSIKNGSDLDKAKFLFDEFCISLVKDKKTVNSGRLDRWTADYPEAYTCGDLSERLKAMFAGGNIKAAGVIDILADKNKLGGSLRDPNINHDSLAIIYRGNIYMFDTWQHAVGNNKQFTLPMTSKWRGMKLADWEKEMLSQGYVRFSTDEGLHWHDSTWDIKQIYTATPSTLKSKPYVKPRKKNEPHWLFIGEVKTASQKFNMADYSHQSGSGGEGLITSKEVVTLGPVPETRSGQFAWQYKQDVSTLYSGDRLTITATLADQANCNNVGAHIAFQPYGTPANLWDVTMPTLIDLAELKGSKTITGSGNVPNGVKEGNKMLLRAYIRAGRSYYAYDRIYEWKTGGTPTKTSEAGQPKKDSAKPSFAGRWNSDYGVLSISMSGSHLTGTYPHDKGRISGDVSADGLTFTGTWGEAPSYAPPKDAGSMIIKMAPDGKSFIGLYWYGPKPRNENGGRPWLGSR